MTSNKLRALPPAFFVCNQLVSDVMLHDFTPTHTLTHTQTHTHRHTHTHHCRSALNVTPLSPNEMLPFGLKLFLTGGSQPVSWSPALRALCNKVGLSCRVAECDEGLFQECTFPLTTTITSEYSMATLMKWSVCVPLSALLGIPSGVSLMRRRIYSVWTGN